MSSTKVNLKDGWSRSDDYKKLYQSDAEVAETLERLQLSGATALLDNGCGNGELSVQAARMHPNLRVFGFDALESAIAEARKRGTTLERANLSFDQAWADDLPLADASVDRALFRNVLHHIAQPRAVFAELARCLNSGGLLLLQTPYNHWEEAFSDFLSEFHFLMDDSHRRFYYSLESIQNELSECGFTVETSQSSPYPFPYLSEPMKDLVLEHGFEERLQLNQISGNSWSVTLHWIRLTAIRSIA